MEEKNKDMVIDGQQETLIITRSSIYFFLTYRL